MSTSMGTASLRTRTVTARIRSEAASTSRTMAPASPSRRRWLPRLDRAGHGLDERAVVDRVCQGVRLAGGAQVGLDFEIDLHELRERTLILAHAEAPLQAHRGQGDAVHA